MTNEPLPEMNIGGLLELYTLVLSVPPEHYNHDEPFVVRINDVLCGCVGAWSDYDKEHKPGFNFLKWKREFGLADQEAYGIFLFAYGQASRNYTPSKIAARIKRVVYARMKLEETP